MKKHYEFVKLSEKDMHRLRNMLCKDAIIRIPFALVIFGILLYLGATHFDVLISGSIFFRPFLYLFALEIVLSCMFREIMRYRSIHKLHKSNLLHYIHTGMSGEDFYTEELPEGFIVQILPVKYEDIQYCMDLVEEHISKFTQAIGLADYLHTCLSSSNRELVNKGVVYTEIVHDQLAMGNLAVLSSVDHLSNLVFEDKKNNH